MRKHISSQVVVSSMETSQVDDPGVYHFIDHNLLSGEEQSSDKEDTSASARSDDVNIGGIEHRAVLLAAGLSAPKLSITASDSLTSAGARLGPSSYRESLVRHGLDSTTPKVEQPARSPRCIDHRF